MRWPYIYHYYMLHMVQHLPNWIEERVEYQIAIDVGLVELLVNISREKLLFLHFLLTLSTSMT